LDFTDALKKLANINYDREAQEEGAVLNGIAWDATDNKIFITGKRWPKLLEIRLN
jgi:glutamine cyclotransferase